MATITKEGIQGYGSIVPTEPVFAPSAPVKNEPAVLSTVNGQNNFNNNIQPLISKANEIVQTAAKLKAERDVNAANTKANAPEPVPADVTAELEANKTPQQKVNDDYLKTLDTDKASAEERATNLTLAATQSAQASIASLTGQWNERRALLEQSNKQNESNWMQQFIRSGQSEYSPGMTSNMISQKEDEGIRKVKVLDDEYNQKVGEINAALESKKYDIAAQKTQELQGIQDKAYAVMSDNAKEATKVNDKIRQNMIQSTRDTAIGNLISQGVTDPAQMLDYLNKDESGKVVGDFTAEEVSKTMKALTVDGKDPKNLSTDIATFEYIRDNYGLPDSIKNLPPEQQYFGYLKVLKAANTAPKAPASEGGYTAEELRKLRQAGIDPTDVKKADDFLYGKNDKSVQIPTFDEYVSAAEGIASMSFGPEARDTLKKQYDTEYGQYQGNNKPEQFSTTELKKLEQANLLNASRKEQLDYLYNKDETVAIPAALGGPGA